MPPPRSTDRELLDGLSSGVSQHEINGNLRDIRRSNERFGGTRLMVQAASVIGRKLGACTLLDVATGSADIPAALLEQAEREGWDLRVVATDMQPQILAIARSEAKPGRLIVERADALALPYEDDRFDIATLALALHHFDTHEAIRALAEMRRVARHYLIVTDLERSWAGWGAAWLFGNLLTRNRLTRHDAPLSARRAYTAQEALMLARAAGWRNAKVRSAFPFRYLLVGRP